MTSKEAFDRVFPSGLSTQIKKSGVLTVFLEPGEHVVKNKKRSVKRGDCVILTGYTVKDLTDGFQITLPLDASRLEEAGKYALKPGALCRIADGARFEEIVARILEEVPADLPLRDEMIARKTDELLILLFRSAQEQKGRGDKRQYQRFLELRKELAQKPEQLPSVAEMAARVYVSVSRFHSVYKSIFGISPKKDFLSLRVGRAKELLSSRRYSVAEVAKMTGYTNTFHFIRQFKDATGVTPGKFAKSAGSADN